MADDAYIVHVEGIGAVLTPEGAQRWERMEQALVSITAKRPHRLAPGPPVGECICPNGGRMVVLHDCPVHDEAAAKREIARAALREKRRDG